MTLDELQVVITANIAQLAPQIREAQKHFQELSKTADTSGKDMEKSVSDASAKTEKALDSENKAQEKSAEATKKATKLKRQSLEEIAEIAQRSAQRYNASVSSMGDGSPLHGPVPLSGKSGMSSPQQASSRTQAPDNSADHVSALQKLQGKAAQVRQSLISMFGGARASSQSASSEANLLTSKLEIANAKIKMLVNQLSSLQAEYGRVLKSSGGASSPEAEKLQEQILNTRSRLVSLRTEANRTSEQIKKLNSNLNESQKSGEKAGMGYKAASNGASSFQREMSRMGRQILSQILVYGLLLKALSSLGMYMWNALKTNTAFSNSLNNLKVQFLTAFQPIYQAALPALTSLINALAKAMTYIAAFISGFFGKTYAQSEQSAAGLNKNVKALQDTSKAAKEAKNSLAGFDQINKLQSNASASSASSTAADAGLLNTDFGAESAKPLISEAQIEAAEKAGERVRAIFQSISDFAKSHAVIIKGAIAGIIGAFLLFKTIMFIKSIVDGLSTAFAFLAANPAVAAALAIAAIAAGVVYLYNTNKSFHDSLLSTWNSIKSAGAATWNAVSAALKNVWDHGGSYLLNQLIKLGASILHLAGYILANFVLPFVSWFVTMITPAISTVLTWVGNLLGGIMDLINWLLGSGKPVLDIILGAISGIVVALGLYQLACFAVKAAQIIWATTTGIVTAAQWLLNAALDANPIGIVILAIAALVGAFILLWNKSDSFRNFWKGLWSGITGAVKTAVNGILLAWNLLAEMLNTIHVTIPEWAPVGGGSTLGFNLPIAHYLATGGIVDQATLAVVGESGKEAVMPLENNTGWIDNLGKQVASRVTAANGGDIHLTIPVYLDSSGSLLGTIRKTVTRDGRNGNGPALSAT